MPEVLEIQIQDKGAISGSSSPPRPPAVPASPAFSRGLSPSASRVDLVQPIATAKPHSSLLDRAIEYFGYGKELRQFQRIFDYFGGRLKSPKSEPSAAAPRGTSSEPAAIRIVVEQGFLRVEKQLGVITSYFADLPEPGPAVQATENTAAAPITPQGAQAPHAPAVQSLRHNLDLDGVFGVPHSPHGAATSHLPQMPSAANEHGPSRPPAVPARAPATADSAAAAEAGETAAAAEGMEATAAAAEGAGVALGAIAAPAAVAVAAFVAVGESIALAEKAIVNFTERAHQLAAFSADIMRSEVNRSVQSLYDDIREGQELGPDLSRMLDAQTSIGHDVRQILLPIKKVIVDVLAGLLETLAEWLKDARVIMTKEFWAEFIQDVVAALKPAIMGGITVQEAWEKINAKMDQIKDRLKKEDTPPDANYLADLYGAGMFDEEPQPAPAQNNFRPNIPVVQFMT